MNNRLTPSFEKGARHSISGAFSLAGGQSGRCVYNNDYSIFRRFVRQEMGFIFGR